MIDIVKFIASIVALILVGVFATFFVLLNWIKQEEKRIEEKNGKINKQDLL